MDGVFRHGLRMLIGLVLAAPFVMHAAGMLDLGVLRTLEYFAYDTRLRLTVPETVDERVVIVDVDEKSLAVEGRWPWPRDRMARLVDALFEDYSIGVLGFDMVFAEQERHTAFENLEDMLRSGGQGALADQVASLTPRTDARFAESLEGRPVALGYYFSGNANSTGRLPEPYLPAEIAETMAIPAPRANGYGANLPVLQDAARHGGFFDNPLSDEDGVFRRAPTLQSYQGGLYESLSLAVVQLHLDQPLSIGDNNEHLYAGDRTVPLDQNMAAFVPYRGGQGSFPYVSASDVLSGSVPDPTVLRNAIVLVGTTAPGLYDLRNTPLQKVYPGVEVHANLISGVLDGRFLNRPAYMRGAELVAGAALAVALAVAFPLLGAIGGAVLGGAALALVVALNLYLWVQHDLVASVAPAVLMILLLFLFNVAYGFITESRSRRALARRFGQYVPPELVEEMSDNPDQYSMKGDRREMSVLFSDVRGFSRLAENMDPEELSALMNELLTALTRVIHEQRGTIDKYMGDAVMAFWGAPLRDPQHAAGAVMAALRMVEAVKGVAGEFQARGWPVIKMGIGINTGPMNVGDMGSEFRMAYTVLGDAVNVGSRLEGLTRVYGIDIVVSESTVREAPDFAYRLLDRVRVKGRDTPLDIYEPLGQAAEITEDRRAETDLFTRGVDMYRGRRWPEAEEIFRSLIERYGDQDLYRLYIDRIRHFIAEPPPEAWDGVFEFQTK
ncbi:MAG: adenylate/guanylate cyclase domain-containing protein [Gammaproteobacteria bacterium]|nr:adenylate/guanylate cyclase domain-containing protein [Gammaproteobacteria bacterium]